MVSFKYKKQTLNPSFSSTVLHTTTSIIRDIIIFSGTVGAGMNPPSKKKESEATGKQKERERERERERRKRERERVVVVDVSEEEHFIRRLVSTIFVVVGGVSEEITQPQLRDNC